MNKIIVIVKELCSRKYNKFLILTICVLLILFALSLVRGIGKRRGSNSTAI